jgi:DNA-binding HxlR family transcriptional regulator
MLHGDAFDPNCPTRLILDRIGDKWSVLVVLSLRDGRHRFTELRDRIGGVTPKVLTQTLRAMERDGLLTRHVFAEVPPRVEYELTPLGHSLQGPIQAVTDWAEANVNQVMSARETHELNTAELNTAGT